MKVAHVLRKYDPDEWGGTESAVLQLLTGLRTCGVTSEVWAPHLSHQPKGDPFGEAGFAVQRFSAFLPTIGISKEERTRRMAVGGNIMSIDLPLRLARSRGIDIVHSHALGRLGATARRVAQGKRVPFVVTIHGGYLDLPPQVRASFQRASSDGVEYGKLFGALVGARNVVSKADAVITCNPREAELLEARHEARRVVRMPHGIDTASYAKDHRAAAIRWLPQLKRRRLLLCVGRIDTVKNQAFLVEQMVRVRIAHPDTLLALVGPVTDRAHANKVETLIEQQGLRDTVVLAGALPPGDPRLLGLYQAAEVVLLPSLSETFGLVLLEAWAAGSAVMATRTSGAEQVLRDGENGYFFSIDDPESFHRALERTLGDRDATGAMIERGRQLAIHEYDTSAVAKRFKELYQSLR
ncbi:MAG: glycosyltransferase family 4 protein [Myxococcales bacterium]|nr:glycosyltransferase family 4 protein [Myxococcales bacterium]